MAMRYNDPQWGDVEIVTDTYKNNGALAVQLVLCNEGEDLATLSVNMDDSHLLGEGVFYAKTYSENEEIAKVAMDSGWFEKVGAGRQSGFVTLPLWKLRATRK